MTIVIGLFDGLPHAQRAITAAVVAGYPLDRVSILLRSSESCPAAMATSGAMQSGQAAVTVAGPLAACAQPARGESGLRRVIRTLMAAGLRDSSSFYFAKAVAGGSVLVAVHCDRPDAHVARELLDAQSAPAASAAARAVSRLQSGHDTPGKPSAPPPKQPPAPVKEPPQRPAPVEEPPDPDDDAVEAQA